jgi:hypothetical protein
MKVYVLETGAYENRGVYGAYATPEAAMKAWNPEPQPGRWSYAWSGPMQHPDGSRTWSFGADWDDAARIDEHELIVDLAEMEAVA